MRKSFSFQSQFCYPNGALMCTTACMQVAMAMLCKQIQLPVSSSSSYQQQQACELALDQCMNVGSVVHGRVERMINERAASRRCGSGNVDMAGMGRMLSVNDLLRLLNINLSVLGVHMEELVVSAQDSSDTVLRPRAVSAIPAAARASSSASRPGKNNKACSSESASASSSVRAPSSTSAPKYETSSCFISLQQLPACMQMTDCTQGVGGGSSSSVGSTVRGVQQQQQQHEATGCQSVCVALATANQHTVCAVCYGDNEFAFFDSAPGHFVTGLNGSEMVRMLQQALHLSISRHSQSDTPTAHAESFDEYSADGNHFVGKRRARQHQAASASCESLPKVSDCDITLLYM